MLLASSMLSVTFSIPAQLCNETTVERVSIFMVLISRRLGTIKVTVRHSTLVQDTDFYAMLTQAGLIYRAIKLHVKLFNWNQALLLCTQHEAYLDIVLWYRRRFLNSISEEETLQEFIQYQNHPIDDEHIRHRIEEEHQQEATRPGTRPYL